MNTWTILFALLVCVALVAVVGAVWGVMTDDEDDPFEDLHQGWGPE